MTLDNDLGTLGPVILFWNCYNCTICNKKKPRDSELIKISVY